MSNEIVSQIISLAETSINLSVVIILLAIGYVLKHIIKKLGNEYIPVILLLAGIILAVVIGLPYKTGQDIIPAIITGIASGTAAIGIHQSGKSFIGFGKSDSEPTTGPGVTEDPVNDDADV